MDQQRRRILGAGALLPVLALGACAPRFGAPRYSPEEGVRRLLELSSERAFAQLLRPGGFYDDELTRLVPPASTTGGPSAMLGAILRTGVVRRQLDRAFNDIAVDAANRAAPIVIDAIHRMRFDEAVATLRQSPTAATDILQREVGDRLIEAMYPEFSSGLTADLTELLAAAVDARTGRDYAGMAHLGAVLASRSIFLAIGREEAEIHAHPFETRDPAIVALLVPGR